MKKLISTQKRKSGRHNSLKYSHRDKSPPFYRRDGKCAVRGLRNFAVVSLFRDFISDRKVGADRRALG